MNRRKFVETSCGFLALAVSPGIWKINNARFQKQKYDFEPVPSGQLNTDVPVIRVTPDDGNFNFTYYDIPAHSPSNRFLAVTKVPYLRDHLPKYGEVAEVCVIDLKDQSISTVYKTKSWGFQTGALLHWGDSDRYLYTNDSFKGEDAVCVRIDLETGVTTAFSGPMYNIAPNGSFVVGFPLELLNITQQGYGIPSKDPFNPRKLPFGAAIDQGVWKTDLTTNKKKLLVSLSDLASKIPIPPPEENGTFYFWHTKINPQSTRILQVLRCIFPSGVGGRNPMVFTYDILGQDIQLASGSHIWAQSGGHPNWHPDGINIIRVLKPEENSSSYRFCQHRYDGQNFRVLSNTIQGGGHPRITPDSRYISTDAFPIVNGVQKLALRLIDLETNTDHTLLTMDTSPRKGLKNATIRLDGHPTWDRFYKKIVFQAAPDQKRQVFIADLSGILK